MQTSVSETDLLAVFRQARAARQRADDREDAHDEQLIQFLVGALQPPTHPIPHESAVNERQRLASSITLGDRCACTQPRIAGG